MVNWLRKGPEKGPNVKVRERERAAAADVGWREREICACCVAAVDWRERCML